MIRYVLALVTPALVFSLMPTAILAQFDSMTLDDCDARIRDRPADMEGYDCLGSVARRTGSIDEAIVHLEGWTALAAHRKLARYQIGFLLSMRRDPGAAGPLRESAEAFALDGDISLEIRARARLAFTLTNSGAFDEAEEHLERAAALLPQIDDLKLEAELRLQQGWTALRSGDYGRAMSSFRIAEQVVFPEGPGKEQSDTLSALAAIHWVTGRFDIASTYYRQQVAHDRDRGDLRSMSMSMGNLLGVTKEAVDAEQLDFDVALSIADEILAEPAARDVPLALCHAHTLHGDLANDVTTARRHFEEAIAVARASGEAILIRGTLMVAGARLVMLDPAHPEEGFEMLAEALEMSRALRGTGDYVRTLEHAQKARLAVGPREAAIAQSMAMFAEIERLRDLQPDDEVRAGAFAPWARAYRRTVSYILQSSGGAVSGDDLALAFRTLERMRARILLDGLDAARAAPATPPGPAAERRERVIEEIVATQRLLRRPGLGKGDRDTLIAELKRLEVEEAKERAAMAKLNPRYEAVRNPEYATLDAVRRALADDEALVSYQVAGDAGGESWALVIDRRGAHATALPSAGRVRGELEILEGLIARRDASEAAFAARIGKAIVEPVLRELPPAVTKLVVIPDGVLWRMPFDALRITESGLPLGWTHSLSLAPSATLWLRWRGRSPAAPTAPVISLADPDLGWAAEQPSRERAWALEQGLALGRLVRARAEGAALVRRLGGKSRLLMDDEASESFLKNEPLEQYALLHLAAHALVDEGTPHRSAILLSPGSTDEDGLLQLREIAELRIDGGVVLLTGCRTAAGATLGGEGPLSLARSFFLAGATGVIGGLWPLGDDDTAEMMERFADRLGEGSSVSDALYDAKRRMIEAGAPAAAWSGLVLIGDGGLVPAPGGGDKVWFNPKTVALFGAGLVALVIVVLIARRVSAASRAP